MSVCLSSSLNTLILRANMRNLFHGVLFIAEAKAQLVLFCTSLLDLSLAACGPPTQLVRVHAFLYAPPCLALGRFGFGVFGQFLFQGKDKKDYRSLWWWIFLFILVSVYWYSSSFPLSGRKNRGWMGRRRSLAVFFILIFLCCSAVH